LEGLWIGSGASAIGAFCAAIIAIVTVYLTRRNDRKALRDKESFDAAGRILERLISTLTLLEAKLHPDGSDLSEWLHNYLEQVGKLARVVIIDAPLIRPASLRDAVFEDADWLQDGFVTELGRVELRYLGPEVGIALNKTKDETHARVAATAGALRNWRATGDPNRSPISSFTRERLRAKAPGIWDLPRRKAGTTLFPRSATLRPLMPVEFEFLAKLRELVPSSDCVAVIGNAGEPRLIVSAIQEEGKWAASGSLLDLEVALLSSPPPPELTELPGGSAVDAWAHAVASWLVQQRTAWDRSPWR
jgi:hypothetical protein